MRPPKFVRFAIALVILCAAALATLLAVIPFIVSTDAIRIRVAQEISSWTGYNVELREAPRLRVFPTLEASVNGITLSKLTDDGPKALMSADRIEVELSPLDALMGHISFTETQIIRPHFLLDAPISNFSGFMESIANSNGRLGTAIRAARSIEDKNTKTESDASQQLSQPFGRVVIKDGIVSFNPLGTDKDELINTVNATFDWPRTTSSATLSGSASWRGKPTQFTLTAGQPLAMLASGTSNVSLNFDAEPINMGFQGKANISSDSLFEGVLSAKTPSLPAALRWLNLPPVVGSGDFGAFRTDTNLSATRGRIRLADLEMGLGESTAKGFIEVGLDKTPPNVTGTLAFDTLDLKKLLSLFVPLQPERSQSPNDRNQNDDIDTRIIGRADIDLRFSAQNASLGPIKMNNVAAAAQIRGGRANFDIGDAQAFDGTMQTNVQLVRDLKSTTAEWRFNAAGVESSQFLQAFGFEKPIINGKGNVSLTMKGPANKWSELLLGAQGNIAADLVNGQLQGFALQDFLQKAQEQRFFGLERKDNVFLAFKRLDLKASLSDGVATLDNARIETNDGTLKLAGIVPFVDRSLALSGEVAFPSTQVAIPPTENVQPQGQTSPPAATPADAKPPLHFFVGGSWERPFISPSTTGVVAPGQ